MLLAACSTPIPSAPEASVTEAAATAAPTAATTETSAPDATPQPDPEEVWAPMNIDPAPGPVVTGGIAAAVGVDQEEVLAAVFILEHRSARNNVGIHAFRAGDLDAGEAADRWTESQRPDCEPGGQRDLTLADRPANLTHQPIIDQCQPVYIVQLDDQTLAILTDTGGYTGNDPANPPPVPYRPIEEIELAVRWLEAELEDVELQPGGPPMEQG